jgi:hypothetical protein
MEKSAAYLMGFQAGFDEELDLEKAAQLIELLEFEPQNAQQTVEFLQKRAGILDWIKRIRAVGTKTVGKGVARGAASAKSGVPASLRVAMKPGQQTGTFDDPRIRSSTGAERNTLEQSARPRPPAKGKGT